MRKRIFRQIAFLLALALVFVWFNTLFFQLFTRRYMDRAGDQMINKSIELDKYLPFDPDSRIVKLDSGVTLTGVLPVLDGATALLPIYAAVCNSLYPEDSMAFSGGDFLPESRIQKTGTTVAYKNLVDGKADIIFVAGPSAAQEKYAADQGVELVYVPIGFEAFVFVVNSGNPVDSLTAEQLRGIYSGKYKSWADFGGPKSPINALQRSEGSGSQTAMVSFMGDTPLKKNTSNPLGKALGFSFRFYVSDISGKSGLKMLEVDGISPTEENIRNGSYPVIENFYAVYRADSLGENGNISKVLDFVLSSDGQKIIKESGYVGVSD